MRRLIAASLAALCLVSPVQAGYVVEASIRPIESDLHYGDAATFDVVFPAEAARQSRQPQYPNKPNIAVACRQDGVTVYLDVTYVADKERIKGGWHGISNAFVLGHSRVSTNRWTGGAASCTAWIYTHDAQGDARIWASTTLEVSA